jgi:hypothetical protein
MLSISWKCGSFGSVISKLLREITGTEILYSKLFLLNCRNNNTNDETINYVLKEYISINLLIRKGKLVLASDYFK